MRLNFGYRIALLVLYLLSRVVYAQMPGAEPIVVSDEKQVIKGQCYYVHVVKKGQTVYAITRSYGMKEYDAVVNKDIHFLGIGDTVWLPCNKRPAEIKGVMPQREVVAPVDKSEVADPIGKPKVVEPIRSVEPKPQAERIAMPKVSKSVVSAEPEVKPSAPERQAKLFPANRKHERSVAAAVSDSAVANGVSIYKERVNDQEIVVSVMVPLRLSAMSMISSPIASDKVQGSSYEFIQFYEGVLLAAEQLASQGVRVKLNVVDVSVNQADKVQELFVSHHVEQSDFIIALLPKDVFATVAQLAKSHRVPIVNPISTRASIVDDNPYVYKCMPSAASKVRALLRCAAKEAAGKHVVIVHSGAQREKALIEEAKTLLQTEFKQLAYTVFDWSQSGSFQSVLTKHPGCAVLSLYNQGSPKSNRIYVGQMLNKATSEKQHMPVLMTLDDWVSQYSDIDYGQLQLLRYHTCDVPVTTYLSRCKSFVDVFAERFKTDPVGDYALMAYDVMMYFGKGCYQEGVAFWGNPTPVKESEAIHRYHFERTAEGAGFEDTNPQVYRLKDYEFDVVL
ncbi:MAG: ABC transporter substrate-binding protein [Bacteroidales bacterium]|nr:ABC transporter substrate-binding protein [Candidatus Colimorpha onthohippi]